MDVLSEVLKAVRLDGALFHNAEFSAPWCVHQAASCTVASYLSPASKHVIIYHLVTEGRGYARLEGDERSELVINISSSSIHLTNRDFKRLGHVSFAHLPYLSRHGCAEKPGALPGGCIF